MKNIGKILVIASLLLTVGCQKDDTYEKSIESGKIAMVDGDYEKAKGFFNMALETNQKNKEADALYKQTIKLIEAKKLKEQKDFDGLKSILDEIDNIESKSNVVKEEVLNLEKEIEKNEKNKNTNVTDSNSSEHKENKTKLVNQIQSKNQLYIEKLNELEVEKSKIHENYGSGASCTAEYVTNTEAVYNKYDKLINEIYSDLKRYLPSDKMNELKSVQLKWIAEKESVKEQALKNEAGAHANWVAIGVNDLMTEMTKERCYELLNYFSPQL